MSFYKMLSQYYDVIFPSNPTQIDFIKRHLNANQSILDIAAGSGNQAIVLAQLGHSVTAIDLDEEMVHKIKEKCGEMNNLIVSQMDMRHIDQFKPYSFDLVICIGNSIVHLDSLKEIKETIKKMYHLLDEHGTLIIQVVNYNRILEQNITKLPIIEREQEGLTFIRTYEHKNGRILFNGEITVEQNDIKETFANSVELYPLTSHELKDVLTVAGFKQVHLFGDFKGNDYAESSPALIAVAKK